jgi:plastocyanin
MPGRRVLVLLTLLAGAATMAAIAPSALGRSTARVTVTATDFKFRFLPARVPTGRHTFTLVNRGQATHDLKIAGKKTRILNTGQRATLTVTLRKGRYAYLCTVPGHAQLGMKGTLIIR